jgi:hypothetical protein
MKNALIPGTPILAWICGNMPTYLSIPKKKLHRFFFNVINWPKVERIMRLHLEKNTKSQFYKNADAAQWQCMSIFI